MENCGIAGAGCLINAANGVATRRESGGSRWGDRERVDESRAGSGGRRHCSGYADYAGRRGQLRSYPASIQITPKRRRNPEPFLQAHQDRSGFTLAFAALRNKWLAEYFGASRTHWEKTSIGFVVSGDWAFERYTYKSTDTDRKTGGITTDTGKGINVFRHGSDGRWRVAIDGWSSDRPAGR